MNRTRLPESNQSQLPPRRGIRPTTYETCTKTGDSVCLSCSHLPACRTEALQRNPPADITATVEAINRREHDLTLAAGSTPNSGDEGTDFNLI